MEEATVRRVGTDRRGQTYSPTERQTDGPAKRFVTYDLCSQIRFDALELRSGAPPSSLGSAPPPFRAFGLLHNGCPVANFDGGLAVNGTVSFESPTARRQGSNPLLLETSSESAPSLDQKLGDTWARRDSP
jgi:hypothetical protein